MLFTPEISPVARFERRSWFLVHPRGLVVSIVDGRLVLPTDDDVKAFGVNTETAHRLGSLDDSDAYVVPIDGEIAAPFEALALRKLAMLAEAGLFEVCGHALHTADWLTTSRFCGRCGTITARLATERCMACPSCGLHIFPRISPAIITLVRKGPLALLASNAKFPGVFYSTLAGFAEIGESLEQTLVREVREEVGIHATNVRYFGSQPWPFPNSLMIAFTADWESGEIQIDPREISDAKWFTADDLPPIPPPLSIARHLIDAWVDEIRGTR